MKSFPLFSRMMYFFLVALQLISCKNDVSKEEISTLNISIRNKWDSNLNAMRNILYEIEEIGGRQLDYVLWSDIQEMIKLRKLYEIPEVVDSIDSQLSLNAALNYLIELKQLSMLKQIDLSNDFVESISKMNNNTEIDLTIKKRLALINILEMEGRFIEDRSTRLGVNCMVICPKINYFRESDKVRVGDKFESIISLSEAGNSFERFSMGSIELILDNRAVPMTYTEMSGAVYMSFNVEEEGMYHYTGELLISYDSLQTSYSCDFEYLITATN